MRLSRIFAVLGLLGSFVVAVAASPAPVQAMPPVASCVAGTAASTPVNWARNLAQLDGPGFGVPDLGTLVASGDNVLWWVDQRVSAADGYLNYSTMKLRRIDLASGQVSSPYAGEITFTGTGGGSAPQRDAGLLPTGDGGLVLVNHIYSGGLNNTVSIDFRLFDDQGQVTDSRTSPAVSVSGERMDIVDAAYDPSGQQLYVVISTRAADGSTTTDTSAYDAANGFTELWSVPGGAAVKTVEGGIVVHRGGTGSTALTKLDSSGAVVWETGSRFGVRASLESTGNSVALVSEDGHQIDVIDPATGTVTGTHDYGVNDGKVLTPVGSGATRFLLTPNFSFGVLSSTQISFVTSASLIEASMGTVDLVDTINGFELAAFESLQLTQFGASEMLLYGYTPDPVYLTDGTSLDAGFYVINISPERLGGPFSFCDAPDPNAMPDVDWAWWHPGDIHAHASGDTNLLINPQCVQVPAPGDGLWDLTEEACANKLIANSLARSERFGTEWVIFTEHMPWLGFKRENDAYFYDWTQAQRQWNVLRQAATAQSNNTVRALIGIEMGTSSPACADIKRDGFRPTIGASPGHYGVYYTPRAIDSSIFDCQEARSDGNGYVNQVAAANGFGGINHPDNADGNSAWSCYRPLPANEDEVTTGEKQPSWGKHVKCTEGAASEATTEAGTPAAFRTMEMINGNNLPTPYAFARWDTLLQNGYRISAVGGGDGHTAPRDKDQAAGLRCLRGILWEFRHVVPGGDPVSRDAIGECLDTASHPGVPNNNKTGGSGRTLVFYEPQNVVTDFYRSDNFYDPVRQAIVAGATVATNGPSATARINGAIPGDEVVLDPGEVATLRIDWEDTFKHSGDILPEEDRDNFEEIETGSEADPWHTSFETLPDAANPQVNEQTRRPDRIVIVTGERDGCGWENSVCANQVSRRVIDLASPEGDVTVDFAEGFASLDVAAPVDGYVRVELWWNQAGHLRPESADFAAIVSPIYVKSLGATNIEGQIDSVLAGPLEGAKLEFCTQYQGNAANVCADLVTTNAAGHYGPVTLPVNRPYYVRVFPPAGEDMLDWHGEYLGVLSGSSNQFGVELQIRNVNDPFIDPSGVVVDTYGNPIEGATVTLMEAPSIDGPFTAVANGAAVMSPGNRSNPSLSNTSGEFRWDVLSGWYRVEATKAGCASGGTAALQIPPPAVGLVIELDCRVPDDEVPTIVFTNPPSDYPPVGDITVNFTVTDNVGVAAQACYDDLAETICDSSYTFQDPPDGLNSLEVLALDERNNMALGTVEFMVDHTAPIVSIGGLSEGQVFENDTFPEPVCTASDETSGIDGDCATELIPPAGGSLYGAWTYRATVTDLAGNSTTVEVGFVTVDPGAGASPPTAVDDEATVLNGGTVDIDVLSNDSDPDGDLVESSLSVTTDPSIGTAVVAEVDGQWVVSFSVGDSSLTAVTDTTFAYEVCDGGGLCSTATVTVQIVPVSACTITGTDGPDTLIGTDGDDIICGLGGNDTIDAGAGNDMVFGGKGADVIDGGDGDDVLKGGRGADTLRGDAGNDVLKGNRGEDILRGGPGDDVLRGGRGHDRLFGGDGADRLFGGQGPDELQGGEGPDVLRGRRGNDDLKGGKGADWLYGGRGSDELRGNRGADHLFGRQGDDSLFGGKGPDVLRGGAGYDTGDGGPGADECHGIEDVSRC